VQTLQKSAKLTNIAEYPNDRTASRIARSRYDYTAARPREHRALKRHRHESKLTQMTAAEFVRSTQNQVERLFEALTDPARCERTMAFVLTGYLTAWSLYAAIAKSSQDIHIDMGEIVAWSHDAGLGTPKHPPLASWPVRGWFTVFPRQDWAYYVFAVLLATIALWITWRLAARYLPTDKRVVGIALLTLVPFYNFHALKFNANTVLTPLWALTTWWFLRSFDTRRPGWAALVPPPPPGLGGPRWCRRRGGDVGQILVGLFARWPERYRTDRSAPQRLF
jgi:hypothetical protein